MYISISDRNGGKKDLQAPDSSPNGILKKPFRLSPVILWLGVVSMFTDVSSESVSAILPLYITGFLGLSTIAFGILDGINQGASALVRIAAGLASDRIGRPKGVAVAGYGLSMVARIGLLFATGFWALTAVVTADRIGKGIRTAPRDALIAVSAQPEYLARHFGVHRMLDNIGAASGPLLAFFILMLIPDGYGTVFVVSLAFAVLGVAVLALLVPNLRTRRAGKPAPADNIRPVWGFRWRLLREPGLGRLLAAAGILGLLTVGDGFIYLVLQNRDSFAVQWFPLLYVGTNVVFLLLAIPLGRLADRWGKARVFIAGHVALLACYLLAAAPVGGFGPTAACLVLLGVFYAATDGVLAALASQLTPPDKLATGLGAAQTVVALSRMAASVGFGVLWFALGPAVAMVVVGSCLAGGIVASWLILRSGLRQRLAA
ncbi:MFS transporter [Arthrobacter sp. PM3]|uniref:MFS transporter n=1 Tax=Arthrobacter sp. PM3 TaxID=2017685 RepID=UPI000E1083B6|nr:MFS transporter [Arthrobacter sp. PM3]AXJ11959.1 MFS transporter [Arthrobacter sp. PM3]